MDEPTFRGEAFKAEHRKFVDHLPKMVVFGLVCLLLFEYAILTGTPNASQPTDMSGSRNVSQRQQQP